MGRSIGKFDHCPCKCVPLHLQGRHLKNTFAKHLSEHWLPEKGREESPTRKGLRDPDTSGAGWPQCGHKVLSQPQNELGFKKIYDFFSPRDYFRCMMVFIVISWGNDLVEKSDEEGEPHRRTSRMLYKVHE